MSCIDKLNFVHRFPEFREFKKKQVVNIFSVIENLEIFTNS